MGKVSLKNNDKNAAEPVEKPVPGKEKKAKKEKRDDPSLPFIVELVFQFSGLFLLLITISVALISFISGAHFVEIFIRTGATIIVCGFLMLILSSMVSQSAIKAAAKADDPGESQPAGIAGRKDVKA